jgi:hypothetical protein
METTMADRIRAALSACVALLCLACPLAHATPEIIFAADFDSSQPLQWIQHHSVSQAGLSIDSGPILVTAARTCSMMGTYTAWAQVPPQLNGDPDYPDYSAIKLFGPCSVFAPNIGDCIGIEGVISEFNGATELTQAAFTILAPSNCGATPISAYAAATVDEVASDSDLGMAQFQPGPRTEALESVLLTLSSLSVVSGNDGSGDFQATSQARPGPIVVVGNNLFTYSATPASTLTSVTGVLDQQDTGGNTVFQLLPRSSSDIVP